MFAIPATGRRPIDFAAENLPEGLKLDSKTGRITGTIQKRGEYIVILSAKNDLGQDQCNFKIVCGDAVALTPPMGWNSWNCFAAAVDDAKVRSAADAMVRSGLIDHGWTYINIDDCWEIKPGSNDPLLQGQPRDENGMINSNKKFPDMKALCDYIHDKGLKAGIYSSPGPLTCAGFTASYKYEEKDAQRYAQWGFDYLKYDWCSYGRIAKGNSLPVLKKPYQVMREALDKTHRDIVYSLCQYGMGDVWQWGAEVGGNCWRNHRRYHRHLVQHGQNRFRPGRARTIRRTRTLERSRHARRGNGGLGKPAPHPLDSQRAIYPHQPVVPALLSPPDRLRHGPTR